MEQGLTQAEVAEAIIVPQSFVSKTELGTRSIRAHELIYYAHALNMEVDKLMLRLRDAVYASPL